jgi:hypothetical protein
MTFNQPLLAFSQRVNLFIQHPEGEIISALSARASKLFPTALVFQSVKSISCQF